MKRRLRIAITGTTGRVGAALARHLAARHEVIAFPRSALDLEDGESISSALKPLECDVFLNPAGMTVLEACEENPRAAMRANSRGPGMIAEWCAGNDVRMIHFSTDYVFSGEMDRLLRETDASAPVNAYGRSKLAGERAVLAYPGNLVLRVSWVFGPEKASFVDAVFHAALAGQSLAAIADKTSLPTYTADLCGWVEDLLETDAAGILHACQSGSPVSWHDMAETVVKEMAALKLLDQKPLVTRQLLSQMSSFRACRPRDTAMDTTKLAAWIGRKPRTWEEALREYVRMISRFKEALHER